MSANLPGAIEPSSWERPREAAALDGGRADRVEGRHAVFDHVGELACIVAVRVDARVRAEPDPHPRLDGLGEVGALDVRGLAVLAQDLLGPAVAGADLLRVVAVVDVGDEPGAVLDHQRDALVVEVRPVLDGAHAGTDRVLDALGAVGVRGDERAALRGLLDGRADLLLCVLRLRGRRAGSENRAGRDHLDEVGAAREKLAHALAHLVLVVRRRRGASRPARRTFRQAGHFAAAAGDGHVGTGDEHARSFHLPRVDGVAERDVHERTVGADVAYGGEAGIERNARVRDAHQRVARRGARERRRDVRRADVAEEVGVQIDEARQHRVRRPVDQPAAGARCRGPRSDRCDAPVLNADGAVRDVDALLDVEHPPGTYDESLRRPGR